MPMSSHRAIISINEARKLMKGQLTNLSDSEINEYIEQYCFMADITINHISSNYRGSKIPDGYLNYESKSSQLNKGDTNESGNLHSGFNNRTSREQ